jgi:hypothetical protein
MKTRPDREADKEALMDFALQCVIVVYTGTVLFLAIRFILSLWDYASKAR